LTGRKKNSDSGNKEDVRIKVYQSLEEMWKQIFFFPDILECRSVVNEQSSLCMLE